MIRPFPSSLSAWLGFGVLAAVLTGCADGSAGKKPRIPPVPVSGVLTINHEPVSRWEIKFVDVNGKKPKPTAVGVTGDDGTFTMATPSIGASGIVPGEYAVGISPAPDNESFGPPESNPLKWSADPKTSGLNAKVTSDGPNEFRFNLSMPTKK
jgi:hypothetical protein